MADDKKSPAGPTEPLPPYEAIPGPSAALAPAAGPSPFGAAPHQGPSIESPFDFPTNPLPPRTEPPASYSYYNHHPIAIPQVSPDATAPFLAAYAPSLLSSTISLESWTAFLNTMSAFLTAKVGDRAISHAADLARHVGRRPVQLGRNITQHAKSLGRSIGDNARQGNLIGAALGVMGGALSLPVHLAVGTAGALVALPGSAVLAAARRPKTPRECADVYAAAANERWMSARGFHVAILDSRELAHLVGLPGGAAELLAPAYASGAATAACQLRALEPWIEPLEVSDPEGSLRLEEATLWLVMTNGGGDEVQGSH